MPRSGTGPSSRDIADFVVRKFVLAQAVALHPDSGFWRHITLAELRQWTADVNEHLSCLPKSWSAEEASAFLCGRPDWPMLASTFACLWDEFGRSSCSDADTPRLIEGALDQLHGTLKAAQHGYALHPTVLVREAGLDLESLVGTH